MPGEAVRLGPFKGGLNSSSDPSSIADDELSVCENFEFDTDGSLSSRPPITDYTAGPVADTLHILGCFVDNNGAVWTIGATTNIIYYDNSGTWVQITTGFRAAAMVQYGNKAWLIVEPGSANPGGSWVPTTPGAAGTFTAVSAMPKGMAGQIFKDRLYICAGSKATTNESRIAFSAIADPATWSGSDFFDVNPGDGQKIIDIYSSGNSLYCFKSDSTYVFSYDSSPTKGVLQPISNSIGVSSIECLAQFENTIYVYHEGFLYELVNYIFSKLNYKVDFTPDFTNPTTYDRPVALSKVGDRMVLRYFDKVYVFNLKTRTWTTWVTTKLVGRFTQLPKDSTSNAPLSYLSGSSALNDNDVFKFTDAFSTLTETIVCKARTKYFDFQSPNLFKRMYWWGVDCIAQGTVTGTVTPVIYSFSVTWGQLSSMKWGDLAGFTWGQPLNIVPSVVDSADASGSTGRRFIKFLKAIRFRNVYFEVQLQTDGTATTSPAKLFTINPVISQKQQAPKRIN
jgi:hypothetical protein